jgi:hypothetical protein
VTWCGRAGRLVVVWVALILVLASGAFAEPPSRTPSLPLPTKLATTYNLAQTAVMLPDGRFVVGRWDGSLQLWQVAEPGVAKNTGLGSCSRRQCRRGREFRWSPLSTEG